MQQYALQATLRSETGRQVNQLRKQGFIPATVYGKQLESLSVSLPLASFIKVYDKTGETGLITLSLDGKSLPVLVHTVQIDPVNEQLLHVEFHQVNLKQKVKTNVPLVLIGEAPVVSEKKGTLLLLLNEIEVEALPADLPDKLEINTELLTEVGQEIKVQDVKAPDTVTIVEDMDALVVKVSELVSKEAEADEQADQSAAQESADEKTVTNEETPQSSSEEKSTDVK